MGKLKALIFNSGMGKRLGEHTKSLPKCLYTIGDGYTIIKWQLELLKKCGVRQAVITTGPFEDTLKDYVYGLEKRPDIVFVHNDRYDQTNYIYSMVKAGDYLKDDIVLMHGDLVMEEQVIRRIVEMRRSTAVIDSTAELSQKDFKACVKGERIIKIGTEYCGDGCVSCQPLYKIMRDDMRLWLDKAACYCKEGKDTVYAEAALNEVTDVLPLYLYDIRGRMCSEIDDEEDAGKVSERFRKIVSMQTEPMGRKE